MTGPTVSDQLREHYENYYEGPIEWRSVAALGKVANIIALCQNYPHRTILEIGAGEGAILEQLSNAGFGEAYYALEISNSAIEALEKRNIPSLVENRLFDGYNVPYQDDQFDLAILSHVLEHVEYPRKLLYEASRVAHYVFVEVPLEDNLRLRKDFVFDVIGHINPYSAKTIRRLVQSCGLEVLDQNVTNLSREVFEHHWGKKGVVKHLIKGLALRMAPAVATSIWTYHSALVCRKPVSREQSVMPT